MTLEYKKVVPWGRSFEEYRRMFLLTDEDLDRRILGCADGPADFNWEMSKRGGRVISCDPLYESTAEKIRSDIESTYEDVMIQVRQNREKFVWDDYIGCPEELGRIRLQAMANFLGDYDQGKQAGRYIPAGLPALPFQASSFEIALCSHFLFFYSDHFSAAFHQHAANELCRVAKEVRIFPLVTYNADLSMHIAPTIGHLEQAGYAVSIEHVQYEFQRGGNKMMRITPKL